MNQVVVLADNMGSWTREVECERLLGATEIVGLENQFFGQELDVAPDDPAYASVDEPKFVATDVDGTHTRQAEVPLFTSAGICEGGNESAGSSVDVNRHIMASLLLEGVQDVRDGFHRFIRSGVRRAEDAEDADRVLVKVLARQLRVEDVVALAGNGHDARFNVKVP